MALTSKTAIAAVSCARAPSCSNAAALERPAAKPARTPLIGCTRAATAHLTIPLRNIPSRVRTPSSAGRQTDRQAGRIKVHERRTQSDADNAGPTSNARTRSSRKTHAKERPISHSSSQTAGSPTEVHRAAAGRWVDRQNAQAIEGASILARVFDADAWTRVARRRAELGVHEIAGEGRVIAKSAVLGQSENEDSSRAGRGVAIDDARGSAGQLERGPADLENLIYGRGQRA